MTARTLLRPVYSARRPLTNSIAPKERTLASYADHVMPAVRVATDARSKPAERRPE